jgi:thymidylate synthase
VRQDHHVVEQVEDVVARLQQRHQRRRTHVHA